MSINKKQIHIVCEDDNSNSNDNDANPRITSIARFNLRLKQNNTMNFLVRKGSILYTSNWSHSTNLLTCRNQQLVRNDSLQKLCQHTVWYNQKMALFHGGYGRIDGQPPKIVVFQEAIPGVFRNPMTNLLLRDSSTRPWSWNAVAKSSLKIALHKITLEREDIMACLKLKKTKFFH